jgi:hypothetical protein
MAMAVSTGGQCTHQAVPSSIWVTAIQTCGVYGRTRADTCRRIGDPIFRDRWVEPDMLIRIGRITGGCAVAPDRTVFELEMPFSNRDE